MSHQSTRRTFLKATAVTGIGFWAAGGVRAQESNSPNERIAFASIGVGGKGQSDSRDASSRGDMVAICDTDRRTLDGVAKAFKCDKTYVDFRKMLDEMGDSIDAVTVSTPDHTHAAAALMAMRMGKHCFCQKPLTRTIYEARLLAETAKKMGVATQMGNQGTANRALRKAAAMIRAGRLGELKAVHVWTNRPVWPQGCDRPPEKPVPEYLAWDEWLSVAPKRPYGDGYHSFKWRGWWDFGTGALGDMACHTVNMPYMGCELRNPTSVQAETSGHNRDSYPLWSKIKFDFPAVSWRPALDFYWYDGGQRVDADLVDGQSVSNSGCVVIGTKGKIYSKDDYCGNFMTLGDVDDSDEGLEWRQSGNHFQEWIDAIKGGESAMSDFGNYAGGLTETILLGNLAVWAANEPGQGPKIEWDAEKLRVTNIRDEVIDRMVKPIYPEGYTLDA